MLVENKVLCRKYKMILFVLSSLVRQNCKGFVKVGEWLCNVGLSFICEFVIISMRECKMDTLSLNRVEQQIDMRRLEKMR